MVEGAVAGSSTGEGGYGERDGSAPQTYPTHQKTEILGYCSPWVPQHHQSRLHSQPHWVPAVCACTLGLRPSVVSY